MFKYYPNTVREEDHSSFFPALVQPLSLTLLGLLVCEAHMPKGMKKMEQDYRPHACFGASYLSKAR